MGICLLYVRIGFLEFRLCIFRGRCRGFVFGIDNIIGFTIVRIICGIIRLYIRFIYVIIL